MLHIFCCFVLFLSTPLSVFRCGVSTQGGPHHRQGPTPCSAGNTPTEELHGRATAESCGPCVTQSVTVLSFATAHLQPTLTLQQKASSTPTLHTNKASTPTLPLQQHPSSTPTLTQQQRPSLSPLALQHASTAIAPVLPSYALLLSFCFVFCNATGCISLRCFYAGGTTTQAGSHSVQRGENTPAEELHGRATAEGCGPCVTQSFCVFTNGRAQPPGADRTTAQPHNAFAYSHTKYSSANG